ncbi:MAG: hypothetical protein ACMUEM_02240 [Flavobacteriales bacterium AspAUS03]
MKKKSTQWTYRSAPKIRGIQNGFRIKYPICDFLSGARGVLEIDFEAHTDIGTLSIELYGTEK